MISLERLMDGLHVEVDPIAGSDLRRQCPLDWGRIAAPTLHYARGGAGVLQLAGGVLVRFAAHSVIILPPRKFELEC